MFIITKLTNLIGATIMPDYSIPYYSGDQLPQEFSDWLDTMPEGYEWVAKELGKEQSTYTFYKKDKPVTQEGKFLPNFHD